MVNDAKTHAEDDKKFKELAGLRNQSDNMIHSSEKSLKDLENELSAEEKQGIEQAIAELKEAMKANDKAMIQAKLDVLTKASGDMAERVYAKKSAADASEGAQAGPSATAGTAHADEGVVDAEFEEVKDDDTK